jgi:hypothetical protein
MNWRKWVVRGLVFSALGGLLLVGLLYQTWTNPAAVRQLVLDKLGVRFLHVSVAVESARLRLLGGISIHDLRMARSDGLDRADFLYVPAAVVYHDKEQLLAGRVAVRKVELLRPQLRLVRDRDGGFNLSGILGAAEPGERMPTVVIRHGTVLVEDHTRSRRQAPPLELKDVQLTIVNDPLPALQVEGTARCDLLGPVKLRGTASRATLATRLHVELEDVPVGPALVQRLADHCPDAADHLRQLSGTAAVLADLAYQPGAPRPLTWDVRARLARGEFSHARLPAPLRRLAVEARVVNQSVPHARLSASLAGARVEATLKDLAFPLTPPAGAHGLDALDGAARELDLRLEHLGVTRDVLDRLPPVLKFIETDYRPAGPVTLTYAYRRGEGGKPPGKRWAAELEGVTGNCRFFPYPLGQVRGTVAVDTSVPAGWEVALDLTGRAGDCPVSARGKVCGGKAGCGVEVDVRGRGLLLDDRVLQALRQLPGKSHQVALQFLPERSRELGLRARPMGRADVVANVRRARGEHAFQNRIEIGFREASLRYDLFPYPLEDVSGVLTLFPDHHWECRDCRGTHAGGEIRVEGRSYRSPPPDKGPAAAVLPPEAGGPAERGEHVRLVIRGRDILLDGEFAQALAPPGLPERRALFNTWQTLALAGRMSFTAFVIDTPGQPQDLDVGVEIQGCTMKPTFFAYALDQVSGSVRYSRGRVQLGEIRARHGGSRLGLRSGLVQLKPGGGFLAWLRGLRGRRLVPDADFLAALPDSLRRALEPLKLSDPLDVETSLTLDAPSPGLAAPLKVWWDGSATLRGASLRAGVDVTGVTGQASCHGHHDGKQMRGVEGHLLFERATVLGQPLANVHARLEVLPELPDTVRLRDLRADLFGGTVGGEARLDVGPALRYDVLLEGVGLRLDQFGKHNLGAASARAQLTGPARAALHLMGEGTDLLGLKGNGRVDVDSGKMGQLPVLLDLLKAFGLRVPDRTAFEEAHVTFAVEGPQVRVQELDLLGSAVSLHGAGTVDLYGTNVNLDFSSTLGRLPLPTFIGEQLLKIKMRGNLGKAGGLRFEKEFVPGVVEPIKRAILTP